MTDLLWLQVLFHPALGFLRNIEMIIFDYDRFFLSLVWQFTERTLILIKRPRMEIEKLKSVRGRHRRGSIPGHKIIAVEIDY